MRVVTGRGLLGLVVAATCMTGALARADTILSWNTSGNAGTETSEPSASNASGVSASNLTLGPGVTAAANGNRLGGNAWFDTGDAQPPTLANSVAGNDYIEFTLTPDAGVSVDVTGFDFIWGRSNTGPDTVTLRSSADGFTSDLASAVDIVDHSTYSLANFTSLTFSLPNITTATTFRLYAYDVGSGTAGAAGTAGFDTGTGATDPNVILIGTVTGGTNVPEPASLGLLALGGIALLTRRRR